MMYIVNITRGMNYRGLPYQPSVCVWYDSIVHTPGNVRTVRHRIILAIVRAPMDFPVAEALYSVEESTSRLFSI